jgi:beta-glucuronidase
MAGRRLTFARAAVAAGNQHRLHARLRIPAPRLWSPSAPNLYRLRLLVRAGGGPAVQHYTVHAGIRDLRVDAGGRLLLNFKPVELRGANLHEDDPTRGAALLPTDIQANMVLLRDLGATMTRSHYPLHPLALELADRFGIVVWSEVPVYQMQDRLFRFDRVRRQSIELVKRMVHRDLNHPSVVVWSLGNENASQPGVGFVRYVREAKRVVDRLDPTRLVGLAFPGYPTVGMQNLYTELDALGMNDYFGWYTGPANSIVDRAGLQPYLNGLHTIYPRQALFVTEFGAEANRDGPPTEKGTFEFQRDFLAYHLSAFAQTPFLNGALVWILRDFKVKPGYAGGNPTPQPPWNNKGLVDDSGQRKPAFDLVREAFRSAPAR